MDARERILSPPGLAAAYLQAIIAQLVAAEPERVEVGDLAVTRRANESDYGVVSQGVILGLQAVEMEGSYRSGAAERRERSDLVAAHVEVRELRQRALLQRLPEGIERLVVHRVPRETELTQLL